MALVLGGASLFSLAGWLAWNTIRSSTAQHRGGQVRSVGVQLGETAPNFSVPTLDGGTYTLSEQRGKPSVLFFMAYWCGTCIPEARALARLHGEYGDQLSILALDIDPSSTPGALAQFKAAADEAEYTWAFDAGQVVAARYQVTSLDTTLVMDPEGTIVYRDNYTTTYQILKEALEPFLSGSAD